MSKSITPILIVGQNPSFRTGSRLSPSLCRLNKWMTELGVKQWSFINASQAKIAASNNIDWQTLELARPYQRVLALGNFAATALSKLGIQHFQLPHPSPLNRKLNDSKYEKIVLCDCNNYLYEN